MKDCTESWSSTEAARCSQGERPCNMTATTMMALMPAAVLSSGACMAALMAAPFHPDSDSRARMVLFTRKASWGGGGVLRTHRSSCGVLLEWHLSPLGSSCCRSSGLCRTHSGKALSPGLLACHVLRIIAATSPRWQGALPCLGLWLLSRRQRCSARGCSCKCGQAGQCCLLGCLLIKVFTILCMPE